MKHIGNKGNFLAPLTPTDDLSPAAAATAAGLPTPTPTPTPAPSPTPRYAPLLLGTAMISRGEIGFLISSVANANGLFDSGEEKEKEDASLFLIVTWAIVLCTFIGPLGVGWILRRTR